MVPDLFIVGATKCATSSIHQELSHSGYISASSPKEPRLLEDGLSLETVKERYRDYFGNKDFRVDANPNHLIIGYVPDKIKLINPDAKILVVVREPVDRLISHLSYFINMRPGREDYIDVHAPVHLDMFRLEKDYVPYMCPEWGNYKPMYVETGCYVHYIPRYSNLFDTKLMVFEDYIADPQKEIDELMDWVGLPKFKVLGEKRNVTRGDKIYLTEHTTSMMKQFYRPYVEELFERTNAEIKSWNY